MNSRHSYEHKIEQAAAFAPGVTPEAGLHEERAHIRAHERWLRMLQGRACPSIEDLEPNGVSGPCEVLIDLRRDGSDPDFVCLGGALIADCGRRGMKRLSDVPAGSYLSLLAAHYPRAAVHREPVAFEGERACGAGRQAGYRGIVLPLSSDGLTVDFIHGAISWREPLDDDQAAEIEQQAQRATAWAPSLPPHHIWPSPAADEVGGQG